MRHAYTLIEVLAVVAIAGLVAAAVTPALVRAATSDALSEAVRQVRSVDRLARQQAVGVGGAWSVVDGRMVSGIAGWQPFDDRLPTGCSVSVHRAADGALMERLSLDHTGCSNDVVVVVITAPGRSRSFRILGLSGAWLAEPVGEPQVATP
jgi:prepilin-type N-terminal cleavage/methylation domain-containing protein